MYIKIENEVLLLFVLNHHSNLVYQSRMEQNVDRKHLYKQLK